MMDNLDRKIKYYHIEMKMNLEQVSNPIIPEGYSIVFYQDGDKDDWIKIELSAREFLTYDEGLEAWDYYFKRYEHLLFNRMMFLVDDKIGKKIGTATAFFNNWEDDISDGYLHWVAIHQSHQGLGLSRALITRAFYQSKCLGYKEAKIPTQTTSPVACKIYLDMGATPINLEESYVGYQILKTLFNHAVIDVPKLEMQDIYSPLMLSVDQKLKSKYDDVIDYDVDDEDMKIHVLRPSGLEILDFKIKNTEIELV
jgi:GNAT superfamily N-acetyltransferase